MLWPGGHRSAALNSADLANNPREEHGGHCRADSPFPQAARPIPRGMCVLPVNERQDQWWTSGPASGSRCWRCTPAHWGWRPKGWRDGGGGGGTCAAQMSKHPHRFFGARPNGSRVRHAPHGISHIVAGADLSRFGSTSGQGNDPPVYSH